MLETVTRVMGRIEQRVDLRDGHPLRRFPDFGDFIAGSYVALLEDTKVKTGPIARGQEGRHARLVHPDADAIAGHARLRHFEQGAADPIAVANADGIVRQPFDGEVFPELAVGEVAPAQLLLP